uniref:Uncharacterized protein n=1 Tax=Romanomermis culicivorax TaxID=13658 RepID=A0A915L1M5_ROMCU
ISLDWKFVGLVFDRIFAYAFALITFVGTVIILLQAPTFYDDKPIYTDLLMVYSENDSSH